MGKAVVNFYLKEMPKDGELWLDFQAIGISDLTINDKKVSGTSNYSDQRIKLNESSLSLGWNTVTVKYINLYNTNSVGLHTYTDLSDN